MQKHIQMRLFLLNQTIMSLLTHARPTQHPTCASGSVLRADLILFSPQTGAVMNAFLFHSLLLLSHFLKTQHFCAYSILYTNAVMSKYTTNWQNCSVHYMVQFDGYRPWTRCLQGKAIKCGDETRWDKISTEVLRCCSRQKQCGEKCCSYRLVSCPCRFCCSCRVNGRTSLRFDILTSTNHPLLHLWYIKYYYAMQASLSYFCLIIHHYHQLLNEYSTSIFIYLLIAAFTVTGL